MILGMDEAQFQSFIERISATAIANQATLRCIVRGLPLTVDNIILFVGDFVDPSTPAVAGLMVRIIEAIGEVVENGSEYTRRLDS